MASNVGIRLRIKYFFQRIRWGFTDFDLYMGLNKQFVKWILPRLKRLLEKRKSIGFAMAVLEWEEMIKGFEIYLKSTKNFNDTTQKDWEAVDKSLNLFRKYFPNLWW